MYFVKCFSSSGSEIDADEFESEEHAKEWAWELLLEGYSVEVEVSE
jgi:hypothetical protein